MKILHVISTTNPKHGGPIEGIRQISGSITKLGASLEIACCDAPGSPWLQAKDLPQVHALGPIKMGYAYTSRLVPWLRQNASRFDVVVVNGIWQYHSLATRRALSGTGTPYFVFTHGMLDPWFKKKYPLKHIKKWLYWILAEYRVLRDARAVIFTCEEERLLARRSFWLYRAREAVTTYGTSHPPANHLMQREGFLKRYPELRGKRIVLFLSRIHEKKGCDLLLEAFGEVAHKDDRLRLVMAGPDQTGWVSKLRERAQEIGVSEKVLWPGMLQGDEKWGAFHASEVFCLPSHQENFGIVVAEALACGKPVIISNKVNIWREIQAEGAGFVGADTVSGTAENLKQWLELDDQKYAQMCTRATDCFERNFHIRTAGERLLEIYSGATGNSIE
ncbi:glycosyltransferase [Cupriavidus sp. CP313]